MKKLLTILAAFAAVTASAQDKGPAATLKIWNNATAPHSNEIVLAPGEDDPDRMIHTTDTQLYIYPADEARATGQAVVICPGGSYIGLAIGHEGHEVARWLAENGITAAVLKYRMPNGHPEVPLEDVDMALRIMAGREAGATGFTADKVGIMGFSAGGHLAATASNLASQKPAFAVLFYPVITAEPGKGHQDSFNNLLGRERSEERSDWYSMQNRVNEATPPTLLFHSDDDDGVPSVNSTLYYNALKAHGVEASLHIYPTGGHGWGIREDFRYREAWKAALLDWLARINE